VETSHAPDGSPNPAYPQALQPRDRSAAVYRDQQRRIASNPNLAEEFLSGTPDRGTPITATIDGTSIVLIGNGRANAKALGFYGTGFDPNDAVIDAQINFSSNFSWDFDRSNGISPGTFDFVGVAIHEIGHAMGFVSGVDVVDFVSFPNGNVAYRGTELDPYAVFSVLDLYRHGARNGGGLDYATGGTGVNTPYFSLDGGLTSLGSFATGQFNGDGRQASHWKDSLGLGIMDPTFAYGELGVVKPLDIRAFDVIGYEI
jgi:hypothetical protein